MYLNTGTDAAPVLGTPFYAQANGADLTFPVRLLGRIPARLRLERRWQAGSDARLADGTVLVALNEHTAAEPRFGAPQPVQVGEPGARRTSTSVIGLRWPLSTGTTTVATMWSWEHWTARCVCC